ncbi:hypothetical protein [Salinibacterium sp.]|uniref:hypothetical protein n=1 Tax=Salinibacterium sp. TaxID=1915057 RepID=UPI00286B8FCF|nr:hypothetical protein [Salinibacterium sp.]
MARVSRPPVLSAQQVDPLSWFTGPLLPLVLSGAILVYSTGMVVAHWGITDRPLLQVIAIVLCTSTGVIMHLATRPLRQHIGMLIGAMALAPTVMGMLVSALGYAGTSLPVEQWWAPGTLALAFASLAPYIDVRRVLVLGSTATVVAVLGSLAILTPGDYSWGVVGVSLIMAYPPLLGLAATVVFSWAVVTTMLRLLENQSRVMVPGQTVKDDATAQFERNTVAQLTSRAVPFLQSIAAVGQITVADRALAGQLARRLRDDLVTQSNLSWLESVASESRLVVVDPGRLARRMNQAQRTALRAMLRAILDTPGTDSGSLMVDLRDGADGTIAVGVSLDMALPEGRRIMHLAPYYLTLKTAVNDLTIETRDLLSLSFRIDGDGGAR